jgi:molybdate transport system permease protein
LAIYLGFELELKMALTLSAILILLSFLALLIAKGFLHYQFQFDVAENKTIER